MVKPPFQLIVKESASARLMTVQLRRNPSSLVMSFRNLFDTRLQTFCENNSGLVSFTVLTYDICVFKVVC